MSSRDDCNPHTHTCTHTHTHTHTWSCTHLRAHTHAHTHIHTQTHTHVHTHTHTYTLGHAHTYKHMHTHAHARTHAQTHTHLHCVAQCLSCRCGGCIDLSAVENSLVSKQVVHLVLVLRRRPSHDGSLCVNVESSTPKHLQCQQDHRAHQPHLS